MLTVYGLKNCDTCRKAREWLKQNGRAHRFHDVRADGLDEAMLRAWVAELGYAALLNTRGTTWRGLPEAERRDVDEAAAVRLMLQHPALIKRPVLDTGRRRLVGFGPATRKALGGA